MQIHIISALGPLPHLGMDILIPPMARLISVQSATKIFVLTSLLIVTGAMAVVAVKRRREITGFAALLVVYSTPFALVLLNFECGHAASFEAMLLAPSLLAVLPLYAAAALSWLPVQRVAQLGAAYTFTARGFLFESLFSSPFCGKASTPRTFVGAFPIGLW